MSGPNPIAPTQCTNNKNVVYASNVTTNGALKVNNIYTLTAGQEISLEGHRADGVADTIQINFQFDDSFGIEGYIYVSPITGTVISVKEAHVIPASGVPTNVNVAKVSGGIETNVVTNLDLSTVANTAQDGTIIALNASLLVGDGLKLEALSPLTGLKGAVLSIVVQLN